MLQIQPYLDYFAANPSWALVIIFLIAFGEALLVIGLFVPSTAVLVGAGALVGSGKLEFWPVILATIAGCILGDQVSYWAGRIYGERLRTFWPLSHYPHLVAKGEEFFKANGGKSIALGRFVPGVKAVVPGIAGMFGMNQAFFLAVNISSGIVWSLAHVLPGVVVGQALALAGELSGRLLFLLLILLVVLAVAGWLIRLFAASLSPYRKALQGHLANWARQKNSPAFRRLAVIIAPENPKSVLVLLGFILFVLAIIGLFDIVSGLVLRHAVGNLDLLLLNLFSELRSSAADELMIRITMLGDQVVLMATAAAIVIWLLVAKAWREAVATIVTIIVARLVVLSTSVVFSTPVAGNFEYAFRFPSQHALMAGTVFGILAVLCSRTMNRWSQALIVASAGVVVVAISFSRLYLGVNWLSDILGGVFIAAILATLYGVAIATLPTIRIRPLGLIAVTLLTFFIASGLNINSNYDSKESKYAPRDKLVNYALADWPTTAWQKLPSHRIDFSGKTREVFVVQWIGSLDALRAVLEPQHFKVLNKWTWHDLLPYLNPHATLADVAPRPATHEGLKAKLTAIQDIGADPSYRITLRAFQSNSVATGTFKQRVYLISLTREALHPQLDLFTVPTDSAADTKESDAFIAALKSSPAIEDLGDKQVDGMSVAILKPKL